MSAAGVAPTRTRVLIAGGGTGGHVYPALALADELVARGYARDDVRFVGATRGIEGRVVPDAGYEIDLLPGRGLVRDRTVRAQLGNVRAVADAARALARAWRLVGARRPEVVVGVGGYASLPAVAAARLRRIPVVVHESDAHPGLANRIAVRLGARPAVSLPGTGLRRETVTGNPIRPEIAAVRRAPVQPPVVAVVGGSLGARRINDATLGLYDAWRARDDVVIHHVSGARDYEGCCNRLAALRTPSDALAYRLVRYEDHMDDVYRDATVMVTRSGGMTAELAAVGMPSVLVPLPGAPGDHQTANAEVFSAAGAAVLVPDADLDAPRLGAVLDELLGDRDRLAAMSAAAHGLAHPDATARFADLVEGLAVADAAVAADLLDTPRSVHVVAIGGSAMSGIASVLVAMGHQVSGSDLRDSPRIAALRDLGVTVAIGHDPANLPDDAGLVVFSAAIGPENPELVAARARGVATWTRTEALRAFAVLRRTVAVAGSHGKTTTTAMLTLALREAGWDPSWFVGGDVPALGATGAWREGEWLVVEADESDGTFLHLGAGAAIVTSVEPDHLAHYGTVAALEAAFAEFVAAVPGPKVMFADDPVAAQLAAGTPGAVTYGFGVADYRIRDYVTAGMSCAFAVEHDGQLLANIVLPVPGRHNAANAAAATAMAHELGVPFGSVQRALSAYTGVARRFELRGVRNGVTFVDDYAHLPTEVSSMIDAAREGEWSRVVAVFQPHRYSRTARLWHDFADAFTAADLVVLTDVYGFDEPPIAGVSGHLVLRAVLDAHPDLPVVYLPTRADLVAQVPRLVRAGDLVLTLGAGDLTTLPDEWVA